jgi:serine/threonine protein kinase
MFLLCISVGAVTYTLLIGRPPFFSASLWLEYQAVKKGDYKWPEQSPVTNLAKDFVDKLLVLDPLKRMTLKDAIEHPWITDLNPSTVFLEEAWIEYSGVKQ